MKRQIRMPSILENWKRLVVAWDDRDSRCGWRQARSRSTYLYKEKAAEKWALQEVCGTVQAMEVRRLCESFGAVYMRSAGADFMPLEELAACRRNKAYQLFEGLLANSIIAARGEESEDDEMNGIEDVAPEPLYDDEIYFGARDRRRAEHGAPRHTKKEITWIEGVKIEARNLARPRQGKRSLAVHARSNASARQLRALRQQNERRTCRDR